MLLDSVCLQRQQDAAHDMAPDLLSFVLPEDRRQGPVVPLSFGELAEVLVAHRLEVLHHLELLERIILEVVDGRLHALLALLEFSELEVGDSLPEQRVGPSRPDL